jgi:hypothetical protein
MTIATLALLFVPGFPLPSRSIEPFPPELGWAVAAMVGFFGLYWFFDYSLKKYYERNPMSHEEAEAWVRLAESYVRARTHPIRELLCLRRRS